MTSTTPTQRPDLASGASAVSGVARVASIERWIVVALVVAAVAPFVSTLFFGYVYDDTAIIRGNPAINGWHALVTLWREPYWPNSGSDHSGLYRPLTMALFAIIWNAGKFAIWFHLFVLALHATTTVLVWRVLRRGVDRWAAAGAALWFAVHPVHVEAVANISNSSEVLVALWTSLLALWLAQRIPGSGAQTPSDTQRRWIPALVAALLFACALLTKESGAMTPALALLWWYGWRTPDSPVVFRRRDWMATLAGWLAVLIAVIVVRRAVLGGVISSVSIAAPGIDTLSPLERAWAMFSLGGRVLRLLVWPGVQNPHYGPSALPGTPGLNMSAVATLLVLATALACTAWLRWRHHSRDGRPLVAVLWTLVAFLPASNLLAATGQVLAERTLYVSSIGVTMLVAWTLALALPHAVYAAHAIRARAPAWRASNAFQASAAVIAVALVLAASLQGALKARRYAAVWGDHKRLFTQMIVADSASYRGHQLLGREAMRANRRTEAEWHLARAYALYPRDRQTLISYSELLLDEKRPAEAARIARQLMQQPDLRTERGAVSLYLEATGRAWGPDSVLAAAQRLNVASPSAASALFIGLAHEARGNAAGALAAYRQGLRLVPTDSALLARAAVLSTRG